MDEIIQALKSSNTFALVAHDNPDDDAIGSLICLQEILKQLDKESYIIMQTKPNKKYKYFLDSYINSYPDVDAVIVLDCSSTERIDLDLKRISRQIIVIDHHKTFVPFGNINYNEIKESTTIILDKLIQTLNINYTPKIATAIYLGIYGDTRGFTTDNVTSETFLLLNKLVNNHANRQLVHNMNNLSIDALRAYGYFLQNIRYIREYSILYLLIETNNLKQYNITIGELSSIMDLLYNSESDLVFLFIHHGHNMYIKSRSHKYNVAKIMEYYNGGGHEQAAGASIYCETSNSLINSLINKAEIMINNNEC